MKRSVCIVLICVFLILPIVSACGVTRPEAISEAPIPTAEVWADDMGGSDLRFHAFRDAGTAADGSAALAACRYINERK